MDLQNLQICYGNSNAGDLCARLPQSNNGSLGHALTRKSYIRILNFLNADAAERAYSELVEYPRYVRTDRMAKPTGIGLGILKSTDESLSPVVQKCCDLLTGADFRS